MRLKNWSKYDTQNGHYRFYFIRMENILEKIKKIEALIQGATTDGEKKAAVSAKERIVSKYPEVEIFCNKKEYRLYTSDAWHKKLLVALCRKYGIKPYRYYRQKRTTVVVNINEEFLHKVLWKEYLEYSELLEKLVEDITGDLIRKIHQDEQETIIDNSLEESNHK